MTTRDEKDLPKPKVYWIVCDGREVVEDSPTFRVEEGDFKVIKFESYETLLADAKKLIFAADKITCACAVHPNPHCSANEYYEAVEAFELKYFREEKSK